MSKTKRTRLLKRRLTVLAIIVVVGVAALLLAPWLMYGTTMATVNGTPIKSKMVAGVTLYVEYAQFGTFLDSPQGSSAKPQTDAEKKQMELSEQVLQYTTLNNLFVPAEVLRQYFDAKGTPVLTSDQVNSLTAQAQSIIAQDTAKTLAAHGVTQAHILYYLEFSTLWQAYSDELTAKTPITDAEAQAYYDQNKDYFQTAGTNGAPVLFADAKDSIKQQIASQRTSDALPALVAKATIVYKVPVDPTTKKPPETVEALQKILGIATGSSAAATPPATGSSAAAAPPATGGSAGASNGGSN
ncbi:MAG: hypothetical protein FWF33_07510 [Clostridiales bacterium]|nr:hypothetical protein [Clostridiales bacterium]